MLKQIRQCICSYIHTSTIAGEKLIATVQLQPQLDQENSRKKLREGKKWANMYNETEAVMGSKKEDERLCIDELPNV